MSTIMKTINPTQLNDVCGGGGGSYSFSQILEATKGGALSADAQAFFGQLNKAGVQFTNVPKGPLGNYLNGIQVAPQAGVVPSARPSSTPTGF